MEGNDVICIKALVGYNVNWLIVIGQIVICIKALVGYNVNY